jgi:hypothetical protein
MGSHRDREETLTAALMGSLQFKDRNDRMIGIAPLQPVENPGD